MGRPTISLACIAKNEGHNVDQFLNSFKGTVDEIIFVDTGSTDDTVEKAKAHGVKLFHFDWINDFGAARNFCFDQVKTDYVVWADLDDVLETKEGFIEFRDNVMHLGDYWLAPYHYSSDASGTPLCTFYRERVFNVSKGFRWKYEIHEGVLPQGVGEIKVDFTQSWVVRHKRTDLDLQIDRSRNISIFESLVKAGKMDTRLWYYYGKELFEADRSSEAIEPLSKALSDLKLEMHDRILAQQYLSYCYLRIDAGSPELNHQNYNKAIQVAQQGLVLSPHRAEFYVQIGDAYLKLGQWQNALPSYEAAKACRMDLPNPFKHAIFNHRDSYSIYPMEQICKIKANLGELNEAEKEVDKGLALQPNHPTFHIIKNEITKLKYVQISYKFAAPCDDITMVGLPQGPYEWDEELAKTKFMGGSETAGIQMARHLRDLSGRKMIVFNNRSTTLNVNGVEYRPIGEAQEYFAKYKPWMNIMWRHNPKLTDAPTFLWCHDLTTHGAEHHDNYKKALCLTPFHKTYLMARQGVPENKIFVTRNGLVSERFNDGPWTKDPFKFVFGSSPDRGLIRAIKVLDRVREEFPEVSLHVFYGHKHLANYGLQGLADQLDKMIAERPWITYHGGVQQDELMKHYKSAAYDVQPSDFIETSCISAMELVCCGVYPIFRKVGGVSDTLAPMAEAGMASLVESRCETESEYELYIQETLKVLREERYKRVHIDAEKYDWKHVAEEWLKVLPTFF